MILACCFLMTVVDEPKIEKGITLKTAVKSQQVIKKLRKSLFLPYLRNSRRRLRRLICLLHLMPQSYYQFFYLMPSSKLMSN